MDGYNKLYLKLVLFFDVQIIIKINQEELNLVKEIK